VRRRNFDTKVELNKTITAKAGTLVQSDGERRIADWLTVHGIAYRYDDRFRILSGHAVRPDFYLPELDIYIEYWGMETADYKIGMLKKQQLVSGGGCGARVRVRRGTRSTIFLALISAARPASVVSLLFADAGREGRGARKTMRGERGVVMEWWCR
jgi:hypothetical protein